MTKVSDNFQRPGPSLGSNWSSVFAMNAEGVNGAGGIQIFSNAYGPVNASGSDAYAIWSDGQIFGADQFARATLSSIAPATSIINITAASQSGGNTTYTYTLTSGSALVNPQNIIISGMQNLGNNGGFVASIFGAGNFTVANASGVNESGSNGTGYSPSDSNSGLVVRGSSDGLNAYFFLAGTNSFNSPTYGNRIYDQELWKYVNGTASILVSTTPSTIIDRPGDVYTLYAIGQTLIVTKNGVEFMRAQDSALTSGTPGIWTWSISGADEYKWSSWNSIAPPPGNNGTRWTNWVGADFPSVYTELAADTFLEGPVPVQVASDNFQRGNGPVGSNWTAEVNGFNVSNNICVGQGAGENAMFWNANSFVPDNQYSQFTVVTATGGSAVGPTVRAQSGSESFYYLHCVIGSAGIIYRCDAGTFNLIQSSATGVIAANDVMKLQINQHVLTAYQNGSAGTPITDNTYSGGQPGARIVGTVGSFKAWSAGNNLGFPSTFSVGANQYQTSSSTYGEYATILDSSLASLLWQNTVLWPNDQYSQCTLTGLSLGGLWQSGPGARISNSTDSAYWFYPDNDGNVYLAKMINGTVTKLASVVNPSYQAGDIYRIEVRGAVLTGKKNGAPIISTFDTSLSSGAAGLVGYNRVGSGTAPGATMKNWSAGFIGASGMDLLSSSVPKPAILYGRSPSGVLSAITTDGNGNLNMGGSTSTVDTIKNTTPAPSMLYGRAPNGQLQAVTTDGTGNLNG